MLINKTFIKKNYKLKDITDEELEYFLNDAVYFVQNLIKNPLTNQKIKIKVNLKNLYDKSIILPHNYIYNCKITNLCKKEIVDNETILLDSKNWYIEVNDLCNYIIEYEVWYTEESLPKDIAYMIIEYMAYMYMSKDKNINISSSSLNWDSISFNNESDTVFFENFNTKYKNTINKYINYNF